jgi:Anthrone oxygenase
MHNAIPLILALLVLGLICGSEFNVAAFGHPVLNRQPLETHIRIRSSMAALFGRVMPFWMVGSTLLNLSLILPFGHLTGLAWRFAAIGFAIQALMNAFSLLGPVPINNRIIKWTPQSLPANWKAEESRWDLYHWFRTCCLIAAFVLLAVSLGLR